MSLLDHDSKPDLTIYSNSDLARRDNALRLELQQLEEELITRLSQARQATRDLIETHPRLGYWKAKLPVSQFGDLTRRYLLEPAVITSELDPDVTLVRWSESFKLQWNPDRRSAIAEISIRLNSSHTIDPPLELIINNGYEGFNHLWYNIKLGGTRSDNEAAITKATAVGVGITNLSGFTQLDLYQELIDTFTQSAQLMEPQS